MEQEAAKEEEEKAQAGNELKKTLLTKMNLWYNVAKEKIGDESKKHEPTIFSMKQKL